MKLKKIRKCDFCTEPVVHKFLGINSMSLREWVKSRTGYEDFAVCEKCYKEWVFNCEKRYVDSGAHKSARSRR